jgi:hypothetical protein
LEVVRVGAFVMLAAALMLAGCDRPTEPVACIAIARAGVTVTVADAASGEPLCDATVVLSAGGSREVLFALPSAPSCTYSGAYERPGTYALEASRAGYQTQTAGPLTIEMSREQCPHVITQSVSVSLHRSP